MRNIEEIAAEEETKIQEMRQRRLRLFFRWLGLAGSLWGWVLFQHGEMGKGALWVTGSLLAWALGWGILQAFRGSFISFFPSILSAACACGLYFFTRLPSFYWGKDPAFWLAVHGGAVTEPAWSPLGYLVGQAACFLLPSQQFSLLPILSGGFLSAALYFAAQDYFFQLRNKTFSGLVWVFLVCAVLAVSAPFWGVGTLASGMTASLGFFLLLLQRVLLSLEERPWGVLYFLIGLLGSVHPLWGGLGLLYHLGSLDFDGKKWTRHLLPLAAGFTPYLWIFFRAGRFFPSWGGDHPFSAIGWGSWYWESSLWGPSGIFPPALQGMGFALALLAVLTALFWFLHFFRWRAGWKIHFSILDFWIWILAGLGGFFLYSTTSGIYGPVILWFAAGLGGGFLKLLEKGAERSQGTFLSGAPLGWVGSLGLLAAIGLAWLPGQGPMRSQPYFPLQHALNLLRSLPPKAAVLICHDPFDAAACREARLMEPIALDSVILDEKYLDQRWYATQVMERAPEILFSNIIGTPMEVVKRIAADNRDLWAVYWDLAQLPPDWKEPQAAPAVLAQLFVGPATGKLDPEKAQYQLDLTVLPGAGKGMGPRSRDYFSRYVTGFDELGKYLMGANRYSDAIPALERAVKLDLDFQEPQTLLAQMYSKQNILEAARLEFEKTVKTHPQQIGVLMKAVAEAQEAKDEAKAAELLAEVIQLNTQLADAEYQLSKIYDKEGHSSESKSLLESSLRLNPQQLDAQMALGKLMERMGNRPKAEQAFRAVLEIDPQNKPAQVELWKLLNKP